MVLQIQLNFPKIPRRSLFHCYGYGSTQFRRTTVKVTYEHTVTNSIRKITKSYAFFRYFNTYGNV
jgi:hypothetical protein